MQTVGDRILAHHFSLPEHWDLPADIELLHPHGGAETERAMRAFMGRYYGDTTPRVLLLGINPGRLGAGVTGVCFTDPIRLRDPCGIAHNFKDHRELSSVFIYEMIEAFGGPAPFYRHVCIDAVCPLGFTKDGKNFNYYDRADLELAVRPVIENQLTTFHGIVRRPEVVFSVGQGTNFKYLKKLNARLGLFDRVVPLPHPRWVMQYRLRRKAEYIREYVDKIGAYL